MIEKIKNFASDKEKKIPIYLLVFSFLLLLSFNLIFVSLGASRIIHTKFNPDGHAELGINLVEHGMIAFDADKGPTLNRGPLYPIIVGFCYILSKNNWFIILIILQSLFASFTVFYGYKTAKELFSSFAGLVTGIILVFHPLVFRYPGMVMLETLTTFFMALIAYLAIIAYKSDNIKNYVYLSIAIALAALIKSTFLIYIPIFFIAAFWLKRYKKAIILFLISLAIIAPWTYRNYRLSNKIIPVHLLGGYNLYRGNRFVENYKKAPLSYLKLWNYTSAKSDSINAAIPDNFSQAEWDMASDSIHLYLAIDELKENPLFLLEKFVINSIMYWTTYLSTYKSLIMIIFRLPLFILLIVALTTIYRKEKKRKIEYIPLIISLLYFMAHLPLFAIGRFSTVTVGIMVCYSSCGLEIILNKISNKKGES